MSNTKYATVTTISVFKHRYMLPITEELDVQGLADLVTLEQVEEFSQEHIVEAITYQEEVTEEEALKIFDKENKYLQSWTVEQKLQYISSRKEVV